MRIVVLLCIVLSSEVATSAEMVVASPRLLKEQCDLEAAGYKGRATISVGSRKVKSGDSLRVEVRFDNLGRERAFYNPFFRPLIPMPACLALFDSDGRYFGDLLRVPEGSRRMPGTGDWVTIPETGSVSRKLIVPLAERGRILPVLEREPSPGTFFLQFIYHSRFISTPRWKHTALPDEFKFDATTPSDELETLRRDLAWQLSRQFDVTAWAERYSSADLFRSNLVEIELLP